MLPSQRFARPTVHAQPALRLTVSVKQYMKTGQHQPRDTWRKR